jgi:hypothetical protein
MNPFERLTREFDRLGVRYLLGGSHASSLRGKGRTTFDVDIVAAIDPSQADTLASALGRDWYAEASQMREAIRRGQSFNLIFIPMAEKFDIFPATEEFHQAQLERATRESVEILGSTVECPVATAEDILIAKLQWYRIGGETSGRQWEDIAQIIVRNPALDRQYLSTWAARLRVSDLLERALAESRRAEQD